MRNSVVLLILIFTTLVGCNKPPAFPEKADAIYQDIQGELANVRKNIDETKKSILEHEGNLKKVVPQTGQVRYAEKRVWEARKILDLYSQHEKYWIVREEQRRMFVRRKSLEAFQAGKSWSDPQELKEYRDEKRLRQAKLNWDVRQRRADFEKELKMSASAEESRAPASSTH